MKVALRWFLGLYIILLGSEELFRGPGLVYASAICLLLVFVTGLAVHSVRIRFSFTGACMILFGVVAQLSIFWSVDPDRTIYYASVLAQLLATTWITATCLEDNSSLELIAWWLMFSPVAPGFFMIRDFLTGSHTSTALAQRGRDLGERMSFAGADPNLSAFRCAVGTLAGIHLGLNSRNIYRKLVVFPVAAFITFSSLLTGSRGGVLALIGGMAVLLFNSAPRRKATVLLAVAGFTVLLVTTIPHLPNGIASRYMGIETEVTSGDMASRKFIYKEAVQSFNQDPTLGVGYLAFASASRRRGGLGLAAHNDLLQVLLDLGLVGLGIFLIMLGGIAWNAFLAPAASRGFMLSLLTCYIISALSITLISSKFAWAVFGVILGVGGFKRTLAEPRTVEWTPPPLAGGNSGE